MGVPSHSEGLVNTIALLVPLLGNALGGFEQSLPQYYPCTTTIVNRHRTRVKNAIGDLSCDITQWQATGVSYFARHSMLVII